MNSNNGKIAVIGMACRFPGARNLDEYWSNLINGKETIKHFTDEELQELEINYEELKKNPNYVPARGVLEDVDKFDASFFGLTPDEASLMDPQHRLWLETVWSGFENACLDPSKYKGNIGVFAGGYANTYILNNILRDPIKYENYIRLRTTESFRIAIANDITHLPTKTAYLFNLKGPAVNVQTACSTSLVAISQACNSLYSFESDICVAGGVTIVVPQESGYIYQEGAIPSPDGHCRPFDAKGQGTVFSNGLGVVILKRLEDAVKDNDHIYAVVDGWAINNDGNKKVSYTAPSVQGQEDVILMAQSFAGVKADEIGYIEAHGTATNLGDPIEIKALTNAFSKTSSQKQFCGIGSVKSNIGHTDAAAGVASFIKVCLAAYYKILPPTINFENPNPHIKFEDSPFYINNTLKKWTSDKKLIIGVSSFGIGGTNAHVILEEPPRINKSDTTSKEKAYILPLSAKSKSSLSNRKKQLLNYLEEHKDISLEDLHATLWSGRTHMQYRNTLVATDIDDLLDEESEVQEGKFTDISGYTFMFPGQGAQFVNMGRSLYEDNTLFRETVDLGLSIFERLTGKSLKDVIYPNSSGIDEEKILAETSFTQPALFIVEYATAKVLIENGITPSYLIGHSIGEYAAAAISGVFDYETALKIVIKRGQLMQSMPSGTMFAVKTSLAELEKIKANQFEIAAENAPESCTISFDTQNTQQVEELLDKNDIMYLQLNTWHAFHSKTFDPILKEFESFVNDCKASPPQIPFISCLTGDFISNEDAVSGAYWAKQLRNTVFFQKGISSVESLKNTMYIEVGPNSHLRSNLTAAYEENAISKICILTLGKPLKNNQNILQKIKGNIWCYTSKEFSDFKVNSTTTNKIPLPTYPFEKKRYWVEHKYENNISTTTRQIPEEPKIIQDTGDLNNVLLSIWKTHFGRDDISLTDNFTDLGGESMLAFSIIADIERQLQVKISFRDFMAEFNTIEKVMNFANKKIEEKSKAKILDGSFKYIYNINPGSSENVPVFGIYCDKIFLIKDAIKDRPIYDFAWPGSDGRPFTMHTVEEIADTYLNEILQVYSGKTFYLIGFSFGGQIAYDIAVKLRKLGYSVPILGIIDSHYPQLKIDNNPIQTLRDKIREHGYFNLFTTRLLNAIKHQLKERFSEAKIFIYFKLNKKLPLKLAHTMIYNESVKILKKYNPQNFDGRIHLFRSLDNFIEDDFLGWSPYVKDVIKYDLIGSHMDTVQHEQNKRTINKELKMIIEEEESTKTK